MFGRIAPRVWKWHIGAIESVHCVHSPSWNVLRQNKLGLVFEVVPGKARGLCSSSLIYYWEALPDNTICKWHAEHIDKFYCNKFGGVVPYNNSGMMAWCVYILQVLHSNNQCGHGVSKTELNDLKVLHERMVLVGRSPYILGSGGFQLVECKVLTSKYLQIKQRCFTLFFGRFYPDNLDSVTWNSHSLYPSNLDVVWLIVGRSQAYIYTYNSRGNFHVARLY